MECNKEEAVRAKDLAERKMQCSDFVGARKIALKAQKLFPDLENISQLLAICEVHCSAQKKLYGSEMDWYGILQLAKKADEETIKKQYHKLALLLHPDKNKFAGAEAAFKMIGESNKVLSDREKRSLYDIKCRVPARTTAAASKPPPHQETFWTCCPFCTKWYYYYRNVVNKTLGCENCAKSYVARDMGLPPPPNQETFWTCCTFCNKRYYYYRNVVGTTMRCKNCAKSYVAHDLDLQGVPSGSNLKQPVSTHQKGIPSPATSQVGSRSTSMKAAPPDGGASDNLAYSGAVVDEGGKEVKQKAKASHDESLPNRKRKVEDGEDNVAQAATENHNVDEEMRGNGKERSSNSFSKNGVHSFPEDAGKWKGGKFDFNESKSEDKFMVGQVWAVYNDRDRLPIKYAQVKGKESNPFVLNLQLLEPLSPPKDVIYPICCGIFKRQNTIIQVVKREAVSHLVNVDCGGKIFKIFPRKGEVWAMYKNWNIESRCSDRNLEYEIVQVLEDTELCTKVSVLVRVNGYKLVYKAPRKLRSSIGIIEVPRIELPRFSHQIPAYWHTGKKDIHLRDCWQLDPSSVPAVAVAIPLSRSSPVHVTDISDDENDGNIPVADLISKPVKNVAAKLTSPAREEEKGNLSSSPTEASEARAEEVCEKSVFDPCLAYLSLDELVDNLDSLIGASFLSPSFSPPDLTPSDTEKFKEARHHLNEFLKLDLPALLTAENSHLAADFATQLLKDPMLLSGEQTILVLLQELPQFATTWEQLSTEESELAGFFGSIEQKRNEARGMGSIHKRSRERSTQLTEEMNRSAAKVAELENQIALLETQLTEEKNLLGAKKMEMDGFNATASELDKNLRKVVWFLEQHKPMLQEKKGRKLAIKSTKDGLFTKLKPLEKASF